jgi:hypothetical protein
MSLRLNKIILNFFKVIYVLVALFSIPNLIFNPLWYPEQQQIVGVPYFLVLIELACGVISISLVFTSLVLLFRLEFRRALVFGLISAASIIIDLIVFLRIYQLPANSEITYYTIMITSSIVIINIYLLFSIYYHNERDKRVIKKILLDLGTQYSRLEIVDIAEKSSLNREKVERVVIEMLNKKELYGEYLAPKKIIEFNVELNIEEIDSLLEIYKKWENQVFFKKKE